MAKNNGRSSLAEEIIALLKTITSLEVLEAVEAGLRLERAQRAMAGRQKGYLCLGGKSLLDIAFVPSHST
jgi:hypothetical protein